MDEKGVAKYFRQTKLLLYVAAGLIAGGLLSYLVLVKLCHIREFYQITLLCAVAGVVVLICFFAVRTRDDSIDGYAASKYADVEDLLKKTAEQSGRKPNYIGSYSSFGYALKNPDRVNFRFGSDNIPRTEKTEGGAVILTPDTVYTLVRKCDLITGESNDDTAAIPVSSVTGASVADSGFTANDSGRERYCDYAELRITYDGGEVSFAVHKDSLADEAAEKINRLAERSRA